MNRIVIFGAGGQGRIVADILGDRAAGFVDDNPALHGTTVLGLRVFASFDEVEHDGVIVAIGDNAVRRAITEGLLAAGERLATAIHPFASIARSATIGEGAMISAGAIVLPRVALGRGVLLNTKSSADHDCVLGDFVHLAPAATLGGNVRIGPETTIGPAATVVSNITIGARVVIGAGAVVLRDLPDDVTAWGVPARITSDRRSAAPTR
jgi:sugar O-acyltransferase (sialic acid O-acetyltransferase NeuD family)